MHAHRIHVLDRADHDGVVRAVAHHLQLELLPPRHGLLDQDLADRAGGQPLGGDPGEPLGVGGDPAAPAAQREGRPDDDWVAQVVRHRQGVLRRVRESRARERQPGLPHRPDEQPAILRPPDRVQAGADQANAVRRQRPRRGQGDGHVERGLPAQRRQQRVRPLALDHLQDRGGREGFDVGGVGELGIGHDRRGVAVDQDHAVAVRAQGLARLGPRVVELARLADHDGSRPDHQDRVDVLPPRHRPSASGTVRTGGCCRGGPGRPRGGTARRTRGCRGRSGPRR